VQTEPGITVQQICLCMQTFEEPAISDADRFDMAAPAIVKPPSGRWDSSDPDSQLEIGILKQFPFSSELQVQCIRQTFC